MTDWDNDILGEAETDETIIDLMDIVNEEPDFGAEDSIIELTDVVDEKGSHFELDVPDVPASDSMVTVSSDQLEAALTRVIEKKFGDRIETLLFEVLEKVIEKEIAEIRESLQKDLDQIGTV